MTAPFLIDLASVSQKQKKADLKTWAQNLPYFSKYQTFFDDEAGEFILTLISGFSSYTDYNDIATSMNNMLFYTQNKASAVGITTNYSYNPFRGRNIHVQLRITPSTNYNLTKFTLAGLVNGVPLSPVQNYTLIQGSPITIECVIGEIETEEFTMPNNKLNIVRYATPKISYDTKLELNNIEVAVTNNILDMLKDYWYLQTNTYGGVDAFYLNESLINPLYPYNTGDVLKLTYIKLANLIFNFPFDIQFLYGTIDEGHIDTQILSNYLSSESKESIQINGPLRNETGRVIKAREDSAKVFKILSPILIDTNLRDVNLPVIYLDVKRNIPAFVDVTYIKNDLTLLTLSEKNALLLQLNGPGQNAHGVPNKDIVDPKKIDLRLNLILSQKAGKDISTYISDIQNIFNFYLDDRNIQRSRGKKLEFIFNLKDLEHDLERLAYINIARASIYTKTWQANTLFKRGEFIIPTVANGYMYEVISHTYDINLVNTGILSELVEPTWSLTQNMFVYEDIQTWLPNNAYALNELVRPSANNNLVYKAFKITGTNTSGPIEPTWGFILNELIEDNDVIWQVVSPYEINASLIYKTHSLTATEFPIDWNEYFIFNYGPSVTWQ